jgi:predicted amidophosphoribosyltransferase
VTVDLGALIERHGWHVIAELAVLTMFTVFTVIYLAALFRGKVQATSCPSCGRVVSRGDARCPRCGTSLEAAHQT